MVDADHIALMRGIFWSSSTVQKPYADLTQSLSVQDVQILS